MKDAHCIDSKDDGGLRPSTRQAEVILELLHGVDTAHDLCRFNRISHGLNGDHTTDRPVKSVISRAETSDKRDEIELSPVRLTSGSREVRDAPGALQD